MNTIVEYIPTWVGETVSHPVSHIEPKRVILESPFAGKGNTKEEKAKDKAENIRYARLCMRDCLLRGEAPMVSHLLYTQDEVLNDDDAVERQIGIDAGLSWRTVSEYTVCYIDRGISSGMEYGCEKARDSGKRVEKRTLPGYIP